MIGKKKHSGNLTLLGGKLCLDFINTLEWRGRKPRMEYLNDFSDVIQWAAYVKIITPEQEIKMKRQSIKNKDLSEKALKSSIELRELLHGLFCDIEKKKKINKQLLSKLNIFFQKASTGLTIKHPKTGFDLVACVDPKNFISLLYPIIWESVNLLTSNDRLRIKSCGDKTCGWVFFDTSKNKSRQWCDMKSCGNRAKARKFYKQKKG